MSLLRRIFGGGGNNEDPGTNDPHNGTLVARVLRSSYDGNNIMEDEDYTRIVVPEARFEIELRRDRTLRTLIARGSAASTIHSFAFAGPTYYAFDYSIAENGEYIITKVQVVG